MIANRDCNDEPARRFLRQGETRPMSFTADRLLLFVVTLCLNVIALRVVRKYREKYD